MRFSPIVSLVLVFISMNRIVLIRFDARTGPLVEQVYCDDVCTDGQTCLKQKWFACKWIQLIEPKIVCCVNRATDDRPKSSATFVQNNCPNVQKHQLTRRSLLSFFANWFPPAPNRTTDPSAYGLALHWPWMVSILVFGEHLCGGVIISENAVITAAHCFVPHFDSSVYKIRIGFNGETVQQLPVYRVIKHDLYFQTESYHDIAIVITQSPIRMTAKANLICLPPQDIRIDQLVGRTGSVIAFQHYSNGQASENLRLIPVVITAKNICTQMYALGDKHNIPVGIQDGMVCATALVSADTEIGDSGSPLMVTINGVYYLIGIVSFGRKSRPLNHPSVYTNAIYYRQWIINKLDGY